MDKKLEEDFQSLKAKSQSKIVALSREDVFEMLKSLDMICSNKWNKVTQRDSQDALDFIEILFTKHAAFTSEPSHGEEVAEIHRSNSILMAIFKSLVKAVLLL